MSGTSTVGVLLPTTLPGRKPLNNVTGVASSVDLGFRVRGPYSGPERRFTANRHPPSQRLTKELLGPLGPSSAGEDSAQTTPNPLQLGVPAERTDERFPFQALHPPARAAVAVQPETRPQAGQGADDNLLHLFALVVRHLPEPRVKHGLPVLPELLVGGDGEGVHARVVSRVE